MPINSKEISISEDLALTYNVSDGSEEEILHSNSQFEYEFNTNNRINNNTIANINNSNYEIVNSNEIIETITNNNLIQNTLVRLNCLKITHWNCNSIRYKVDDLSEYLNSEKIDVICLNELKTNNTILLNQLFSELKYTYVATIRKNENGGGVAILIKDGIEYEMVNLDNNRNDEIIGVKIRADNKMFVHVFAYYKAPKDKMNKSLFSEIDNKFKNYLIAGDLNAHLTNYGADKCNEEGNLLNEILLETNAIIINNPNEKTYYKLREIEGKDELERYEQTLDYILCSPSIANKVTKCGINCECDLRSDHYPIEVILNIKVDHKDNEIKQSNRVIYNYERADWDAFSEAASKCANENIISNVEDKNEIFKTIVSSLKAGVDSGIPTIKINKNGKMNLPPNVIALKKTRNYYQNKYRKSKKVNIDLRTKFYKAQNDYLSSLYKFKSEKWQKFLDNIQSKQLTSKPFWKKISKARNKRKQNSIPTLIHPTTKEEIADDLEKAQFFGQKLQKTFSTNDQDYNKTFDNTHHEKIKKWHDEFTNINSRVNQIEDITYNELRKAINSLNNKTSVDGNNISNIMLKHAPANVRELIRKLFNLIIKDQDIPDYFKMATVTMIPKTGQSSNPNNYRPISVTSTVMRLLEKALLNRIWNHLKKKKIIIDTQSGFRSNRQTKDNLIYVCQRTLERFNYNKKSCAIFYDIASAFDKVWHEGVIFKMNNYGFPKYLTMLINNYLKNRHFKIRINDIVTDNFKIQCGVPQGGVLSPILFSIFINDIPINQNEDEFSMLFADDLVEMFIVDKVNEETSAYINNHLKELEIWLNKWRLKMAPHKCNYLIFSKNKKTGYAESLDIELYGSKIENAAENNVKFLGIRFDKHFSFKNQMEYLKHTCNERINILKVISHSSWKLDKITLLNTYKLLVRSVIDYSLYLYDILSVTNQNFLQTIQNKCVRIIYKEMSESMRAMEIQEVINLELIKDRALTLKNNYLTQNLSTSNPVITSLVKEYKKFDNMTSWRSHRTLLDDVNINELEANVFGGEGFLDSSQSSRNSESSG